MAKRGRKKAKKKRRRRRSYDPEAEKEYGADPDIPTVLTAQEIIEKAFKRASKVSVPDKKAFYAARKTAMAKLDSVSGTIGSTLERYVTAFPDFDTLHPFHKDLYAVLFDVKRGQKALSSIQWSRGQVASIAKKSSSQIQRSKSRDFIGKKVKEAYGRINSVLEEVDDDLQLLADIREALDKVPKIVVDMPTAVVAGSPNVGKSLLVRKLSTGKPEVAPYPFTTKAVSVGHFEQRRIRYQVLDTPGLLDRPLAKRNKIEQQAVLALRHLAEATVFIFDPTEECGTSLDVQRKLLEEIERDFAKGTKVFEVYNKSDISERWASDAPEDAFVISAMKGDGIDELKEAVAGFLRKRIMESDRLF
jgi:nucleolar GTP-binding protein